jgi:hypothetical protein
MIRIYLHLPKPQGDSQRRMFLARKQSMRIRQTSQCLYHHFGYLEAVGLPVVAVSHYSYGRPSGMVVLERDYEDREGRAITREVSFSSLSQNASARSLRFLMNVRQNLRISLSSGSVLCKIASKVVSAAPSVSWE